MRCLMWGRESINTPVKVKGYIQTLWGVVTFCDVTLIYFGFYSMFCCRAKKDPLTNPQGPDLANGFGNALTTALDVMSFTHEVDINAQGLNLSKPPVNNHPINSNQVLS